MRQRAGPSSGKTDIRPKAETGHGGGQGQNRVQSEARAVQSLPMCLLRSLGERKCLELTLGLGLEG